MSVNWDEIQKVIYPTKNFEELCRRLRKSFTYPVVVDTYNFNMPELANYTQKILGDDHRGRYGEYASHLVGVINDLYKAGILNVAGLLAHVDEREKLERFSEQTGIDARWIASVLKFFIYWFIPMEKYLSGLVRDEPSTIQAINILRECGVRTNLDMLQAGKTAAGRRQLAESSRLAEAIITDLVNRSDFSRMPWASKATISNIIGAGYGSIAKLAGADPDQLYDDFFYYGKAIGKNLKLGNEIESSYRIAKILPGIVDE
jgi:hypothetical protein